MSRCEDVEVAGELAVGEGGIALKRGEGLRLPEHLAEGFEEAAREIGLHDVF